MSPHSPLFVDFDGVEINVGVYVASFFEKSIGMCVTSTIIRSLIETSAHKAFKENRISHATLLSIHGMNGHTSSTTQKYYQKESILENLNHSRSSFSQLVRRPNVDNSNDGYSDTLISNSNSLYKEDINISSPTRTSSHSANDADYFEQRSSFTSGDDVINNDTSFIHNDLNKDFQNENDYNRYGDNIEESNCHRTSSNEVSNEDYNSHDNNSWMENYILPYAQWGKNHPDYNILDPNQKARWTTNELKYITSWITNDRKINPSHSVCPVYRCLKAIRTDPIGLGIFHKRHVLKSDRLRVGYLQSTKKLMQNR